MTAPLKHVVLDMDDTLFHHAPQNYTAMFTSMADVVGEHLARRGIAFDADQVLAEVYASWHTHRLGTRLLAEKHGLDILALHREYHDVFFSKHIKPAFNEAAAEQGEFFKAMRGHMEALAEHDVRFSILTHASESYGRVVSEAIGISDLIHLVRGIDNYNLRMKHDDETLFLDFMRELRHSEPESVALLDDSKPNVSMAQRLNMRGYWVEGQTSAERQASALNHMAALAREVRADAPRLRM